LTKIFFGRSIYSLVAPTIFISILIPCLLSIYILLLWNSFFTLNHFDAAFCELKRLNRLFYLDLRNNRLEGVIPSCLGMIGSLQELILSNNRLYGNLPSSILSKQSKIQMFDVSANQLDGVLSFSTFANASSLQYLNLSGNRFHGNLPPSIFSKQSKIKFFDVSANQLDGVLSFSTFANASSLVYLDLSSNYNLEIETESPSWVPTFQLNYLNLANCSLNKKNGHVIPSFITTQVLLYWLDLSHNLIEGSIPCELLFNSSIRVLSLGSNKIDGSLFLSCSANRTSSLKFFDMSYNNVKGSLPENIGHLLPKLLHVDISSNALEGIIPWSFGNLSCISKSIKQYIERRNAPKGLQHDKFKVLTTQRQSISRNDLTRDIKQSLSGNPRYSKK
jgi:hypothetical protein